MKKYKINGTEKKDDSYCSTCQNGVVFEKTYHTDPTNDKGAQHICSECNTKYIIPKIDVGFDMEIGTIKSKTVSDVVGLTTNELTKENKVIQMIKIAENFNKEVAKIQQPEFSIENNNPLTAKADVGHDHNWVVSQPFKTYDGEFTIKNCAECKIGELVYKGATYRDTLMRLVNFVSDMGIMNREKDVKANVELDNLFEIDDVSPAQSDTGPLFELDDEPSFEILDMPEF